MPLLDWMPLITANTERAQKAAQTICRVPGPPLADLASSWKRWRSTWPATTAATGLPNGSPAMRSAMTEFSETAMAARV